jgi:DNA end-binding protein Ku
VPVSAPAPKPSNVVNLFDALKKSLNSDGDGKASAKSSGKARNTKAAARKPAARKASSPAKTQHRKSA